MLPLAPRLLPAVAAALALGGCGDDSKPTPAPATGTPLQSASSPTPEPDSDATTIRFHADPDGALRFLEDEVSAPPGRDTISLDNPSSVPHDVVIRQDGERIGGTEVVRDGSATTKVTLKPGRYEYFCSVPGHEEAGMKGTLTVE